MDKAYRICAVYSEKETVQMLGAKLDKKEKDVGINESKPKYYFRIIEEGSDYYNFIFSYV